MSQTLDLNQPATGFQGIIARVGGDPILELVGRWQTHIEDISGDSADVFIADSRYGHAHAMTQLVMQVRGKVKRYLSDRIDQVVLNRYLGVPIFLLVMYLMFMFTINFGGAFIDFFDGVAGAFFVRLLPAFTCFYRRWKTRDTWRARLSSWTDSCAPSVCRARPSCR